MFGIYHGDVGGLTTDEDHKVYRWTRTDCKILFSATRQGNAMSCHMASDKAGLRLLRTAIHEFADFIKDEYPWCEMIFAKLKKPSIMRFMLKSGFEVVYTSDEFIALARRLR